MDVVRFKGGLGNQMFQYALVEALRERGREVKCSLGFYRRHPNLAPFLLDTVFDNVILNEISDEEFEEIDQRWKNFKKIGGVFESNASRFFWVEEETYHFKKEVFDTHNCTFVGYWQTEKYFMSCRDRIRKVFSFHDLEKELVLFGNKLKQGYIGVHVRKGDYVDNPVHDILTEDYYHRAMAYVRSIMPEVKFIFFSDDQQWVREHFKESDIKYDKKIFKNYEDWYDMYLMSQCSGNIIANSSFSWWGAWLNQNEKAVVIAPKRWINKKETPDIWCESWIKI